MEERKLVLFCFSLLQKEERAMVGWLYVEWRNKPAQMEMGIEIFWDSRSDHQIESEEGRHDILLQNPG